MIKRKLKKVLKNEIEKQIPNVAFLIEDKINWQQVKENNLQNALINDRTTTYKKIENLQNIEISQNISKIKSNKNKQQKSTKQFNIQQKQTLRKKFYFNWKLLISSLACLIIFCSIILPLTLIEKDRGGEPLQSSLSYSITINVNPCFRLEVNENDIVTKQYGLNEQGVVFLYKEKYIGKNINEANRLIVEKLNLQNILKDKISIKTTYLTGTEAGKEYKSKQNFITAELSTLGNFSLKTLTEVDIKTIETYYETNHINNYALSIVNKFKTKIIECINENMDVIRLLIEKLNDISIKELKTEIKNYKKNFNSKLEIDEDDLDDDNDEISNELIENLNEDLAELQDILKEIEENGKSEDDFANLLEELFDHVEKELFQEILNNN